MPDPGVEMKKTDSRQQHSCSRCSVDGGSEFGLSSALDRWPLEVIVRIGESADVPSSAKGQYSPARRNHLRSAHNQYHFYLRTIGAVAIAAGIGGLALTLPVVANADEGSSSTSSNATDSTSTGSSSTAPSDSKSSTGTTAGLTRSETSDIHDDQTGPSLTSDTVGADAGLHSLGGANTSGSDYRTVSEDFGRTPPTERDDAAKQSPVGPPREADVAGNSLEPAKDA